MKGKAFAVAGALFALTAFGNDNYTAWLMQTNLLERTRTVSAAGLPNVLILGDSISLGYTPFVRKRLQGIANVSRPDDNCGPSQKHLKLMKTWVGTNHWDVIHVNFGIWDNHYLRGPNCAPWSQNLYREREVTNALPPIVKGTSIRDLGFRIRTPINVYEQNLRTILAFLKEHADKVVFGLTTPLTSWAKDDRCGRIRVYNEMAVAVAGELDVAIDDLYAVAERHLDLQSDGCHFNDKGYDLLAEAVCASVCQALEAHQGK